MCIFCQDEMGRCFIDGWLWDDWKSMPKCIRDCEREVTIKDVRKMQKQFTEIRMICEANKNAHRIGLLATDILRVLNNE